MASVFFDERFRVPSRRLLCRVRYAPTRAEQPSRNRDVPTRKRRRYARCLACGGGMAFRPALGFRSRTAGPWHCAGRRTSPVRAWGRSKTPERARLDLARLEEGAFFHGLAEKKG